MALSKPELEGLAHALSMMIDAMDKGMTRGQLRARFAEAGIPAGRANTWFDIASTLHEASSGRVELPKMTNPRYRKGTAMKPVAWSDCLWSPTP